jgi:hypothetical protein
MGLKAGLNEKCKYFILQGLELQSLGRPARSQSHCRLSYAAVSPNVYNIATLDNKLAYLRTEIHIVGP